jgi:hypothetical protein
VADGTAQARTTRSEIGIADRSQHDPFGRKRVDSGLRASGLPVEQTSVVGEDLAQQIAGLAPVDAEATVRPEGEPGVLLTTRADRVKPLRALGGREERRRCHTLGEGGHAALAAAPDGPAVVAVALYVPLQPAVPDGGQ